MISRRPGSPPVLLKYRSNAAVIVTTVSFAVFTDVFLYGSVVPVLPFSLQVRLLIPETAVQYWVSILLAVYGGSLLAFSPFWGWVTERYQSRRGPMLFGLVMLAGATVFLCVSSHIALLVVGRFLQGASAALTWTVGLALVVDTVDSKSVGTAMGWVSLAMSLGILLSPFIGGIVYGRGGYFAVFAVCFGLLAVDIVLRLAIIEVKIAERWRKTEEITAGPLANGLSGTPKNLPNIPETNERSETGDKAADVPGCSEATEQTQETPERTERAVLSLFNLLHLFRKPRLVAALWGTLVHATITTSFDSTLPLVVSDTFGWDSTGAGLVFIPLIVPSFLGPLIGYGSDKFGPKWFAAGGFLLATPFLICLRFITDNSIQHKILLCVLLVGIGVAVALVLGPLMAEISWAVEADAGLSSDGAVAYALAYSLFNMAFSGGAMLGPVIGGLIRQNAGWGTVGWSLGLLAFVTAGVQVIWVGGTLGPWSRQ